MGAVIAHTRPYINATVWPLQRNVWRCSAAIWMFRYRRRNMDPTHSTRDQGTIKTVGFSGWTCTKEDQSVSVGQQGHGHSFWDARDVIDIDYLVKGKTMRILFRAFGQIRYWFEAETTAFGEEKSAVPSRLCTCVVTMAKIHKLGYELLPHPAYSPSDYLLFPNLKKWLSGKRFGSNEEVITETNAYFEGLEKTYYLKGIKKLEKRWTKCIELKGDYVEK